MTTQSQIDRLRKELASLRQSEARETANEAKETAKLNRAFQGAQRANNPSTLQSKMRDVERAQINLANIQKKKADLSKKIANKMASLASYEQRLSREQHADRKKVEDHHKRMLRDRQQLDREVHQQALQRRVRLVRPTTSYDFFICHASEDKELVVNDLARALEDRGKKVWYDDDVLRVGMSLRSSIDEGLANSRFGVVIISRNFFGKQWPERELNGLFSLEDGAEGRVLPIWHEVSKDEVARHSPMLADRIALSTSSHNVQELADELCSVLDG